MSDPEGVGRGVKFDPCCCIGRTAEDFTRLPDTLRHAALVTGTHYVTHTVPVEAVVRLRLWDRYQPKRAD